MVTQWFKILVEHLKFISMILIIIDSTTLPTEVHIAGEFDTTTSTVNDLKYNGAKFSVSSAVDAME